MATRKHHSITPTKELSWPGWIGRNENVFYHLKWALDEKKHIHHAIHSTRRWIYTTRHTIIRKRRVAAAAEYLVCCCEQYNITPATTTTTTLTNIIKKYRGLYKMEEKKEMNLHKWLLLALDVLSSCTPFYPYILWHISPQGVRYGLELHRTYE